MQGLKGELILGWAWNRLIQIHREVEIKSTFNILPA